MIKHLRLNTDNNRYKIKSIVLLMLLLIIVKVLSGLAFILFIGLKENDISIVYYSLYSNVFIIGIVILVNYFYNNNTLKDLGIEKISILEFCKGVFLGIGFIILIFSPILILSKFEIEVINISFSVVFILIVGFLIQSISEEIIFRGYIQGILVENNKYILSICIQSCIFAVVHILNGEIYILGLLNLFLFGFVLGLIKILTKNIYVVSGIHFIWNTVLVLIIDSKISGILLNIGICKFDILSCKLISGGNFGIEGSIVMTIVMVCCAIKFLKKLKKKEIKMEY